MELNKWNSRNYASEFMLRELTPEEKGGYSKLLDVKG